MKKLATLGLLGALVTGCYTPRTNNSDYLRNELHQKTVCWGEGSSRKSFDERPQPLEYHLETDVEGKRRRDIFKTARNRAVDDYKAECIPSFTGKVAHKTKEVIDGLTHGFFDLSNMSFNYHGEVNDGELKVEATIYNKKDQ